MVQKDQDSWDLWKKTVIEFTRHVLEYQGATSEEIFVHAEHCVVVFMPEGSKE